MARFVAHCLSLAALGVCIPAVQAQDHLLDDLYGRGVHAYFSKNYLDAHKHLSDAVTSGSQDPRVYYFRALADNRLKRPEDAAADLKMAAQLEFSGEEPVLVSKALERVQGMERLMIEDVRAKARLSIRNASEERAKIRYENRVKAEAAVLRTPAPGTGAPPAAAATPAEDKTDPFGTGTPEPVPAKPATEDPAAEKPAAPAKPATPAKPAAEDPFGDAPAKPAAPAAEKPAVPAAEEKPVPATEKPATPAKPAVDDPFGDAPAKPAAPATEKPAAPAAEEKPAAPATEKPAAEAPGEVKPASATAPAAASGKGSTLGSFMRAFSKAVPGEAKVAGSAPAAPPPAAAPPALPAVDPNTPDPFGDAPAKPAAPKAGAPKTPAPKAVDPFADDPPAKPAGAPAKPAPKAAEDDPFK